MAAEPAAEMAARLSLVTDFGEAASTCGYCRGVEETSWSHGMQADFLTPEAYQQLLDRGWRRSGRWVYKPIHSRTCCQMITIRLNVHSFEPNKDQRKVRRKWERFLSGAPLRRGGTQHAGHAAVAASPSAAAAAVASVGVPATEATNHAGVHRQWQLDPEELQAAEGEIGVLGAGDAHADLDVMSEDDLQGASPKRPRGELGSSSPSSEGGGGGGGKRQRSIGADLNEMRSWLIDGGRHSEQDTAAAPAGEGAGGGGHSPTAALSERLAASMRSGGSGLCLPSLMAGEEPTGRQGGGGAQRPAAAGEAPAGEAAGAAEWVGGEPAQAQPRPATSGDVPNTADAAADPAALLCGALQGALAGCIAAGELPEARYPRPAMTEPTPKQRKLLPAGVVYTSPLPRAVAGVARKQQQRGSDQPAAPSGAPHAAPTAAMPPQGMEPAAVATPGRPGAAVLEPNSVGALLLQRMPQSLTEWSAEVRDGHLNFSRAAPLSAPTAAAEPAATGPEAPAVRAGQVSSSSPARGGGGKGAAAAVSRAAVAPPPEGQRARRCAGPAPSPRHFELTLLRSHDPGLPALEFSLYKKYQVVHHGDDPSTVTPRSFRRFLCDSPLLPAQASDYPPGCAPPCGFGSFHQQYWLDGRLVAVGVIDVLPRCLSSKYFFWDPDLGPLSLGKLASLLEIDFVRECSASCPSLKHYYLGFYIHSCHRMRYKADFGPSEFLCPVDQCWVPVERVQAHLDAGGQPPHLAAVPGALEGLGAENLVGPDGRPTLPPRLPSADDVDSVRLFIPASSRGDSGHAEAARSPPGGGDAGGGGESSPRRAQRRGQMVTFRQLCALGVLSEGVKAQLRRRLQRWMLQVGPAAWPIIVYQL